MNTIGIIGLGPVGTILAAHLAKGGVDVVVEDINKELLAKVRKNGLIISGVRELSVKVEKIASSLAELVKFEPDIVFISTKACFLKNVLDELKPIYTREMKVVSFQNGLDTERLIAETLEVEVVYRAVINYAGNLVSPGHVRMNWFQPPNYIGAFRGAQYTIDETTKYIADLMTTCGLETEQTPDIRKHIWEKTILNSALCPICALTGQTIKEVMEFEFSRNLAIRVLEEGLAVAKADGYDLGEHALDRLIGYLEKGGAHKPSMVADVENKRATEIDFMNGAIVNYGEKYGVKVPMNSFLTALIKSLENKYLRRNQSSMCTYI